MSTEALSSEKQLSIDAEQAITALRASCRCTPPYRTCILCIGAEHIERLCLKVEQLKQLLAEGREALESFETRQTDAWLKDLDEALRTLEVT